MLSCVFNLLTDFLLSIYVYELSSKDNFDLIKMNDHE